MTILETLEAKIMLIGGKSSIEGYTLKAAQELKLKERPVKIHGSGFAVVKIEKVELDTGDTYKKEITRAQIIEFDNLFTTSLFNKKSKYVTTHPPATCELGLGKVG